MIRRILVPLDGSAFGEHALVRAIALARRHGALLDMAHVHEFTSILYMEGVPLLDTSVEIEGVQTDRSYLDRTLERVRELGVNATATLLDGPTVSALETHTTASGADLVVMATHGRGPLSRAWLGSVADGLARHITRPVLMVRPPEGADALDAPPPELTAAPRPLGRVLLPVDEAEQARAILDPALAVADEGASVLLLHVAPRTVVAGGREHAIDHVRVTEAVGAALEEVLAEVRARGRDARLQVEVARDVASCILEIAQREGAELIALTTHGQRRLSELVLGDIADKVLRGASAPVLLRRP